MDKVDELVDGGSVINGANPSSLNSWTTYTEDFLSDSSSRRSICSLIYLFEAFNNFISALMSSIDF